MTVWYCSVGSSNADQEGRVVWSLWCPNETSIRLMGLMGVILSIISLTVLLPDVRYAIALVAIPIIIIIIVMSVTLSAKVEVTENGLIIETRSGNMVTIPKDEVKNKNILCIKRTGWGLQLRIYHKSVDVSLPLSQGQYEALINALREHWNWTPPGC